MRIVEPGYVTPASIVAARDDLTDALKGIELDESEARIVAWLLGWDQPTLHTLASIIRKARDAD